MATFANPFAVLAEGDVDEVRGGKADEKAHKASAAAGKKFKPATSLPVEEKTEKKEVATSEAPRRGREFDRHVSGTGRLKGEQKKGGAGKGNWGAPGSEVEAEPAKEDTPEVLAKQAEEEAEAAREREEEEKKVTLEEYLKSRGNIIAPTTQRQAGEGEDSSKWAAAKAAQRSDQDVFAVGEKERKEKLKEHKEKVLLETNFRISTGESAPRGRGRGRGRGGFVRREREEGGVAPVEGAAQTEHKPREEGFQRRGGRGAGRGEFRGRGRGEARGRGGFGAQRGGFSAQRGAARPTFDREADFPSLA